MAKGMKTGGRDFLPGQSGNPSGHPKGFAEFRAACRGHSEEALQVLVASLHSEDERVCLEAAKALLERAWGKPASAPEDLDAARDGAVAPRELVLRALARLTGDES